MISQSGLVKDVMADSPRMPVAFGLERAKKWWVVLLTIGFWFARPYYFPLSAAEERNADGRAILEQASVTRQISLPLMGLIACYMLWRIPRRRRIQRFQGPLAAAAATYFGWALLSLLWDADFAIGVKRLTVFFLAALIVYACAKTFRVVELAKMGFFACGTAAAIALLVDVFITHEFKPLDPDYRFLGVMSANSQGMNLTVFLFCGLTLLMKYPAKVRSLSVALFTGAILLFLTRSRTASLACLVLALPFLRSIFARHFSRYVNLIAVLVLAAATIPTIIASGRGETIFEKGFMMGREDTENTKSMSNRTPLWHDVSEYIRDRPLTGYGFHAFWTPDHIYAISSDLGWTVPNAHDIYLDETLSGGVGGAVLYAFILWGGIVVSFVRYRRNPAPETLLPFALIAWLFISGWVESVPLDPFLPTFLAYTCLAQCMLPESPYRKVKAALARGPLPPVEPGWMPVGVLTRRPEDGSRAVSQTMLPPHSRDRNAF